MSPSARSKLLLFVIFSLTLALASSVLGAPPTTDDAPYTVAAARAPQSLPAPRQRPAQVLLISVDGLSYPAFRRHRYRLPNIARLARRGTVRPLVSSFPSMTWAAHTSMLTGQHPRHHGVLANRWLDADGTLRRPYADRDFDLWRQKRVPSLVELAASAGLSVAALNWPGSQGSKQIRWNLPEMYGVRASYDELSKDLSTLVDRYFGKLARRGRKTLYRRNLLDRVAQHEEADYDLLVRDLAVELVTPRITRARGRASRGSHQPPHLLLAHFLLPDTWQHRYGTSRLHERWSLELVDAMIGRILGAYRRAGLLDKTAVLIVSDHGFAEITHTMDLRRLLKDKGYARYLWIDERRSKKETFVSVLNGQTAFLYPRTPETQQRLPELVKLLRSHGNCIERIMAPAAYAKLGLPLPATQSDGKEAAPDEHIGAPALVVLARPYCLFKGRRRGTVVHKLRHGELGYHGYLPRHPQLQAVMIAGGPGLAKARRALVRASLTDIAPTLAHLLGLRWPTAFPSHPKHRFTLDGRVLGDMLAR